MAQTLNDSFRHFRKYWKNYVLQSCLVSAFIFAAAVYLGFRREIIIASIGASAFTVFCLPEKFTARSRNVLGGHLAGLLCGWLGVELNSILPFESVLSQAGIYAFAVGLCCLIMVVVDVEHPAAAGTALGIAIHGFSLHIFISLTIIITILSAVKWLLRNYLVDLA